MAPDERSPRQDAASRPAGRQAGSGDDAAGGDLLIVGAGQAGLQLAVTLRRLGDTGRVVLVGEEPHPPYQRPPLSKEYLAGTTELDALALRQPGFYEESGIELLSGDLVTAVTLDDPSRPGSGTAVTASGRTLPFARLALTPGVAPRTLDVPGAGLDGVCVLRDRDHALALRPRLHAATRVVVIGGGFIGLETAAAARALGKDVTVVESAPGLMGRAVAPVVSGFYRAAHERRGTRVLLSAQVAALTGEDHVTGVELADGTLLPADLVLVGVGAVPRTELARQLGLDCDGGIVVDAAARTSNPAVCAAGDCTVQPHPLTGEGRVRLESVQNAIAQATAAAHTLAGAAPPPPQVPWFWSFQGDLKLQIAGLSAGFDEHVVRGDPGTERFSVLYYRHGTLIAADAVNSPADYMAVRKALAQGATVPPEAAADQGVPLKAAVTGNGTAVPAG